MSDPNSGSQNAAENSQAKAKPRQTLSSLWTINDRASCDQVIRNGAIAAFVSAGITALVGIAGIFLQGNTSLGPLFTPWVLVDAVFGAILALLILKLRSRIAAVALLGYYIYAKVVQVMDAGELQGAYLTVMFLFFYAMALRGTFLWHSKYKSMELETGAGIQEVPPASPEE